MKLQDFIRHGLLDEFANCIQSRQKVDIILEAATFPRGGRPRFRTDGDRVEFWMKICQDISSGVLPGGAGTDLQPLVDAAAQQYPSNLLLKGHRSFALASEANAPLEVGHAAETGRPLVFLSYSRADSRLVRGVLRRLLKEGLPIWFDEIAVDGKSPFSSQIESAIESTRVMVICVGPNGIGQWQGLEIPAAYDWQRRTRRSLVPVLLTSSCQPADLPALLRTFNAVQLADGANDGRGMQRLVHLVRGGFEAS